MLNPVGGFYGLDDITGFAKFNANEAKLYISGHSYTLERHHPDEFLTFKLCVENSNDCSDFTLRYIDTCSYSSALTFDTNPISKLSGGISIEGGQPYHTLTIQPG